MSKGSKSFFMDDHYILTLRLCIKGLITHLVEKDCFIKAETLYYIYIVSLVKDTSSFKAENFISGMILIPLTGYFHDSINVTSLCLSLSYRRPKTF